ncbi:MAG: hypothetical protein HY303_09030 [Candidatus Wallbacteria bacterium]|nr:hypothetical protein [Candidatus Wallbacteria bacterium]
MQGQAKVSDDRHQALAQQMQGQAKVSDDRHQALVKQMEGHAKLTEERHQALVKQMEGHAKLTGERQEALAKQMEGHAKLTGERHEALVKQMAGNHSLVEGRLTFIDKRLDQLDHGIANLKLEREVLERKLSVLDEDLRSLRNTSDAVWSGLKDALAEQQRRLGKVTDDLFERLRAEALPQR